MNRFIPRVLIIDDVFGRTHPDSRNADRASLCGKYLFEDVTGDEGDRVNGQKIKEPLARVVFDRGQTPRCAAVGDTVENDLEGTVALVREGWGTSSAWTLVLLDLCFYTGPVTKDSDKRQPGMPEGRPGDDDPRQYFGLRILERLHAEFPDLPVIVLSSKEREGVSQSFTMHGALGFIPRADAAGPEKLRDYVWRHGLIPDDTGQIVGNSRALMFALRAARRAAVDRRNVLIRGERGVGKELLAAYMNRNTARGNEIRPLVTVDSGALTPSLFASELFGHVRGAYTGADRDRQGRIVQANGGDLFFDEIGNMPADVQIGLLRVLETRVVMPLGAASGREVDVRFIAATNEDIELKAALGKGFRADLLDRLREGGTIVLSPLHERRDDIPLLAEQFVRQAEAANSFAMKRKISAEAMHRLVAYDWPGNVRELRNCIFQAVNDHPDVEHMVPDHLRIADETQNRQAAAQWAGPETEAATGQDPGRSAGLSDVIGLNNRIQFDSQDVARWSGRLSELQQSQATILSRLLQAALDATKRRTLENPEGIIQIHPAIKLITGDPSLSASKAADIVKRLLTPLDGQIEGSLREALSTAIRLRPRRARAVRPTHRE